VRRVAVLAVLVATAAALSLAPAHAVAERAARPSLDVVSLDPLRIRGERFRSAERVRVTAWINGRRSVARTRAGRRGVLTVVYPVRMGSDACTASVTAVAVGDRGSRAALAFDHIVCQPTR
jgi:hypothetical protein